MELWSMPWTISPKGRIAFGGFLTAVLLGLPFVSFAHEAYVLTPDEFSRGFASQSFDALKALTNSGNVQIALWVMLGTAAAYVLAILFRISHAGQWTYAMLKKTNAFGPLFVRAAISASLFYSALTRSFLGPELHLASLPFALVFRWIMFVSSAMFLLGVGTEFAAFLCLVAFTVGWFAFGWYLITYLNYFGELVALFLFGSRKWSLDRLIQGTLKRFSRIREYETVIVRVCYGIALMYAAISVKFLHPLLTVTVVEKYNLTQFHWLFPSDPLLITLGAALAETAIGMFIIIGFETQLTVLISLFYITLSLLYFKEAVWPHLMLYGISLNLIFNEPRISIDAWMNAHAQFIRSWAIKLLGK